jgi:hypothetical protein
MTIQQELNLGAVCMFIGVAGLIAVAFRTPAGTKRTYYGIYAAFFTLFGIHAATSAWQRTLSASVQGALAVSYLGLAVLFFIFTIFFLTAMRKSSASARKTPDRL